MHHLIKRNPIGTNLEARMYLVETLAIISIAVKEINALVVNAVSGNDTAIDIDWEACI